MKLARLGELLIGGGVQLGGRLPDLRDPGLKVLVGDGDRRKILIGEAGAAVLHVPAGEPARLIGQEVKPRLHARHGVNLAAQRRDHERVHHRVGGDLQTQRSSAREHQFVDNRDVLLGIEEQPLPILRHDLNFERARGRIDAFVGIEPVRVIPHQRADRDHDTRRHQPGQRVHPDGIAPVRVVDVVRVTRPVPPHKYEGHDEDRNHHDQHQAERGEQQVALDQGDRAFRVEHGRLGEVAPRNQQRQREPERGPPPSLTKCKELRFPALSDQGRRLPSGACSNLRVRCRKTQAKATMWQELGISYTRRQTAGGAPVAPDFSPRRRSRRLQEAVSWFAVLPHPLASAIPQPNATISAIVRSIASVMATAAGQP